ncbi:MAG: response regulator [Chloroflexi bacterium]|nr:response regulator [Chloroflexota bacterium]
MSPADERDLEIAALRERLSRLGEASLRITEDLDLDAVLNRVLEGARLLTGASRGGLTVIDDAGRLEQFVSSGLTEEAHRGFVELPGGEELFAYLSSLPEPLRVADFRAHSEALGLPEIGPPLGPLGSFLGAPIRIQSARVGNLYLSDKEGEAGFTREDEDTLVLFASQAALAIANARRHREEQRARADLETLIDTSPVGVAVFDAGTGAPLSFNREMRRIVEGLRDPGQPPEELLEVVSCRRADGREVSLREFPMAQLLSAAETVRAEEFVISVPDGRSVTAVVNATPIRSEEGTVQSMVVTMQDMTPIEEGERLRADFLAMVSHELRAPLTSIKGAATTILDAVTDLDPALVRQFVRIMGDQADHMHALVSDLLDVARIETGALPVHPEPAELAPLVERARNAFSGGGNRLAIDVEPDLPLVLADRRRIVQVLVNLLANAARHSPPDSVIRVSAARSELHVAVVVSDEGRGIPGEQLPHLFRTFSGGRPEEPGGDTGLGLAICKGIVEAHGGRIWAESDGPGLGARFTFTLPTVGESGGGPATPDRREAARPPQRERGEAEERVRVLVVDDDPQDLRYVRDALTAAGYQPLVTGDPEEALRLMEEEEERPRLALLDLMLPDGDGVALMQAIRAVADVPVIFLSAYGRDELIARALDEGAVDYVVKPFSATELAARIRAGLRRREASEPPAPYAHGDLAVDFARRRATLGGRPLPLVALEYRLLAELAANAGQVLTYAQLRERVWGGKGDDDVRPMRTIVSKLRRKLGDDADRPTYLFTEPRVGYWMPAGETGDGEPAA